MRGSWLALFAALALMPAAPVAAQKWPERTVKLVVPYPAGGNVDGAARITDPGGGQRRGMHADHRHALRVDHGRTHWVPPSFAAAASVQPPPSGYASVPKPSRTSTTAEVWDQTETSSRAATARARPTVIPPPGPSPDFSAVSPTIRLPPWRSSAAAARASGAVF